MVKYTQSALCQISPHLTPWRLPNFEVQAQCLSHSGDSPRRYCCKRMERAMARNRGIARTQRTWGRILHDEPDSTTDLDGNLTALCPGTSTVATGKCQWISSPKIVKYRKSVCRCNRTSRSGTDTQSFLCPEGEI